MILVNTVYQRDLLQHLVAGKSKASFARARGVSREAIQMTIVRIRVRQGLHETADLVEAVRQHGVAIRRQVNKVPKPSPAELEAIRQRVAHRQATREEICSELGVSLGQFCAWIPRCGAKRGRPKGRTAKPLLVRRVTREHQKREQLRREISQIEYSSTREFAQ